MADNTLTALQPVLFAAARTVPRELTGFLAIAGRDFNDQGINKGGTVKVTNVPAITGTTIDAAAQVFTEGAARTIGTIDMALNQTAQAKWKWTAEEERQLMLGGTLADAQFQTLKQAWRTIANLIEAYVATTARAACSRAVGTAGTTPFATTTDLLVDAQIALKANGSNSRRACVLSLPASAKMQKLVQQQKVSEAGTAALLREGQLGKLHTFDLLESGFAPAAVAAGTGASYTTTSAGFAVGTTSLPLITGTGTVLAGDKVTFAGDSNIYVVKTGVAAPGTIVLQEPGLLVAMSAATKAMTITAAATSNIALGEDALKVIVRPALQVDGAVAEQMVVTDDQTKLSALLLRVPGDQQASWYLRAVYDAVATNPYSMIDILG